MTTDPQNDDTALPAPQIAAATAYHEPPSAIPREAMWAAIEARRRAAPADDATAAATEPDSSRPAVVVTRTVRGAEPRTVRWIAGLMTAAVMVVAINVLGPRGSSDTDTIATSAFDSTATGAAWQRTSTEHFGNAESMLTTFSTSRTSSADAQLSAWSRDLLASTRLLMDSPAGRDPKRQALLQELELVLVQLVESAPSSSPDDTSVMDELLTRSALLLTRIRTTVPAGVPESQH